MIPKRFREKSLLSILVAGCSPLDQQLIGQALRVALPVLHIAYTSTTQQTLDYLKATYEELFNIPSLLLLDNELIKTPVDWQWLGQLTASYPLLIVAVLSRNNNPDWVATAYRQGIRALLIKPVSHESWSEWAMGLIQYWGETATMPRIPV